jgi:predicted metal-binding protein
MRQQAATATLPKVLFPLQQMFAMRSCEGAVLCAMLVHNHSSALEQLQFVRRLIFFWRCFCEFLPFPGVIAWLEPMRIVALVHGVCTACCTAKQPASPFQSFDTTDAIQVMVQ